MITLEKVGNALKFTFSGNSLYLQDGTIEVPLNSLTLVTDTSDLATFKKSASNDIFVSAPYSELGMTKLELETWFKNNACSTGGGGGGGVTPQEVQTMIDESISGKADTSSLSVYADSVEFDNVTNYVKFYHGGTGGTEVYSFDASSFVIDGMVDDVRIETLSGDSYLVIDFNTASGKEDIEIPISDIFDAENYYTKTEVDSAISAATNDMATQTWVGQQGYITGVDLSDYATLEALNEAVSGKADTTDVTALNGVVTAHTADTTIHVTAADKTAWNAKSDFSGSYNDLSDKPTIPTVPTSNTAFTNDAGYITSDALVGYAESTAVTQEISEAVSGKADSSSVYTKSETSGATEIATALSGKQDTLSAGTNITIVDNVISATGGGGGGSTYSAGTNIDITNDTISCTLPIREGSHSTQKGIIVGDNECSASGVYSVAVGHNADATGNYCFAMGSNTSASGQFSVSFGAGGDADGNYCYRFGTGSWGISNYQFAVGWSKLSLSNEYEIAFSRNNISNHNSNTYGNSGNTLFSIGNGYDFSSTHNYHNAFEVRQNGDIYIPNTDDTGTTGDYAYSLYPMVRLQDTVTATAANTMALGGLKLQQITQADYDALVSGGTVDSSTLYVITNVVN